MVLMIRRPIVVARRSRGKLDPKWDLVKKVFEHGVYQLATIGAYKGFYLRSTGSSILTLESKSSSKPANCESRKI